MTQNSFSKHLVVVAGLVLTLLVLPPLNTVFATTRSLYPSEDSFVDSTSNDHPFGTSTQLSVFSTNYSALKRSISYLKFDLSSVPPYAIIDSAYLKVYATSCSGLTSPNKLYVGRVSADWSESTLVWTNKPAYVANFSNLSISTPSTGYKQWSVRQLVKLWTTGVSHNYGLSMDFAPDTSTLCHFNSSESQTDKPYLALSYSVPAYSITEPEVSAISARTAKFNWNTTGFNSDTYVYFGLPGALTQLKGVDESVTQHAYTLVGLTPETRYEYRLMSKDSYNTTVKSQAFYFTTTVAPAPATPVTLVPPQRQVVNILNVKVTEITDSSAKVSWETSRKAASYLFYSKEGTEVGGAFEQRAFTAGHSTILTNLEPETRYIINIGAESEDEVSASVYSSSFKTVITEQIAEVDENQVSEEVAASDIPDSPDVPDAPTQEPGTNIGSTTESQNNVTASNQEALVSLMSNPLLISLFLPGAFILISIIIFLVIVVIIVKLLKRSGKQSVPTPTPVQTPTPTPTPTQDSTQTTTNNKSV